MKSSDSALSVKTQATLLEGLLGLDFPMGHGHFSRVYETGRNTVLKLTTDTSYIRFMESAKKSTNAFMPKYVNMFGSIGTVYGREVFAVELEMYREIHELVEWEDRESLNEYLDQVKCVVNHSHRIAKDLHSGNSSDILHVIEMLRLDHLELIDALYEVNKLIGDDCFCDLHSGNWMIDKSGQVVFSDPIASEVCDGFGSKWVDETTHEEFVKSLDIGKILEIREICHGDRLKSTLIKMRIESNMKTAVTATLTKRSTKGSDIKVMLKGSVLGKDYDYATAKHELEPITIGNVNFGGRGLNVKFDEVA